MSDTTEHPYYKYLINKYSLDVQNLTNMKAFYIEMGRRLTEGMASMNESKRKIVPAISIFADYYKGSGAKEGLNKIKSELSNINLMINLIERIKDEIKSRLSEIDDNLSYLQGKIKLIREKLKE